MSEIRKLSDVDFDDFSSVVANAYPGMNANSPEERERLKQRVMRSHNEDPTATVYGLFRDGKLLGGMRLHDFTMKLLSTKTLAGGVGMLAVDLLHKKEKVAKEMIAFFLQHYLERGACIVSLYPFRPNFYEHMGFGFGAKMDQYRIKPAALPKGPSKANVHFIDREDKAALRDCYTRILEHTNGLFEKTDFELDAIFDNATHRIVAYKQDSAIRGYTVFNFEPLTGKQWLLNDLHVKEFFYETREALLELMTFLHSQADQFDRIIFDTQDEHFHRLFSDPRNGSDKLIPAVFHESHTSGVGVMYRVLDVHKAFAILADHNFGGQSCTLKLTIDDSFLPSNHGSTIISFDHGKAHITQDADHDVEVQLNIANFSSLLTGAVDFKALYRYGLAEISSEDHLQTVDAIFRAEHRPWCVSRF